MDIKILSILFIILIGTSLCQVNVTADSANVTIDSIKDDIQDNSSKNYQTFSIGNITDGKLAEDHTEDNTANRTDDHTEDHTEDHTDDLANLDQLTDKLSTEDDTEDLNADSEDLKDDHIEDMKTDEGAAKRHTNESDEDVNEHDTDDSEDSDSQSVISNQVLIDNLIDNLLPDDYEENRLEKYKSVSHINETFKIGNRLIDLAMKWLKFLEPLQKKLNTELYDMLINVDISPQCISGLNRVFAAAGNKELWAYKFIDSFGLIPSGITSGTSSHFGEYNQCLSIKSPKDDRLDIVKGKYCLLRPVVPVPPNYSYKTNEPIVPMEILNHVYFQGKPIQPSQSINNFVEFVNYFNGKIINIGICFPSTCSSFDIEELINYFIYPIIKTKIEVGPECHTDDMPVHIDGYQVFTFVTFGLLIGLVSMSTIYEMYKTKTIQLAKQSLEIHHNHDNESCNQLFTSFSLIRNNKKFHHFGGRFESIDAIRLIAAVNVIIFHYYNYEHLIGRKNLFNGLFTEWYSVHSLIYSFLRNYYLVDLQFCISGLILSYTLLNRMEKSNGSFSYLNYVLIRWFRFTPSLVGSIMLYYLLPLFGSGPMWIQSNIDNYVLECKTNFISNIFYYNNLELSYDYPFRCNLVSWWLSAAFQMFLIAPIFIVTLFYKPKLGIVFVTLGILLGSYLTVVPRIYYGILAFPELRQYQFMIRDTFNSFQAYYYSTQAHLSVFIFGLFVGYLIKKKPNLNFGGRLIELLLWIVFSMFTYIGLFWDKDWYKPEGEQASYSEMLMSMAFGKLLFVSGFGWLFYMCTCGRAECLNKLFSWKYFSIGNKLVLGIFLNHVVVLIYRILSIKQTFILDHYNLLSFFCFDFLITLLIAFIFYYLIEAPFDNLVKIFLEKNHEKLKDSQVRLVGVNLNLVTPIEIITSTNIKPSNYHLGLNKPN